jgi:hypothetical protein
MSVVSTMGATPIFCEHKNFESWLEKTVETSILAQNDPNGHVYVQLMKQNILQIAYEKIEKTDYTRISVATSFEK